MRKTFSAEWGHQASEFIAELQQQLAAAEEAEVEVNRLTRELKEQQDGISRVWTALGITTYTGKSLWEHVALLTADLAAAESLLECRMPDTSERDWPASGPPKTANDLIWLLSCYVADYMPEPLPDDKFFAAWERYAEKPISELYQKLTESEHNVELAEARCERLEAILRSITTVENSIPHPDSWESQVGQYVAKE